jgi:outer membrane protein assembly factor BamB
MNNLILVVILLFLSSCSDGPWLGEGSRDPKLPGKRISALDSKPNTNLQPMPLVNKNISNTSEKLAPTELRIIKPTMKNIAKYGDMPVMPIITQQMAFQLDDNNHIYAYKLGHDQVLWSKNVAMTGQKDRFIGGGLAFDGTNLFVTAGHKEIMAFNASTGKELWRRALSGVLRNPPLVSHNTIFALTIDSKLYAISSENGNIIWSYEGVQDSIGIINNINIITSSNLVISPFGSELYAFNIDTGEQVWQTNLEIREDNIANNIITQVIHAPNNTVITCSYDGKLRAHNTFDGSIKWESNIEQSSKIVLSDNVIYQASDKGIVAAFNISDGKRYWSTELSLNKDTTVSISAFNKQIVIGTNKGYLITLSSVTGSLLDKNKIGNSALYTSKDDELFIIETNSGKIVKLF